MKFITLEQAAESLRGKRVVIVGSAPSVLENKPGYIDSHDVVVRVNNYKTGLNQGGRCDVFYSFFGSSIRKSKEDLISDGVRLCMCKCPDAKPIESDWHEKNNRPLGIDFRYIYELRKAWWFCDTYIPTVENFVASFKLLGNHVPSTGFAAILEVLACKPASVYLTGFDFFASGIHNVDEPWRPGNPLDPIGHQPRLEVDWISKNAGNYPIELDWTLKNIARGDVE